MLEPHRGGAPLCHKRERVLVPRKRNGQGLPPVPCDLKLAIEDALSKMRLHTRSSVARLIRGVFRAVWKVAVGTVDTCRTASAQERAAAVAALPDRRRFRWAQPGGEPYRFLHCATLPSGGRSRMSVAFTQTDPLDYCRDTSGELVVVNACGNRRPARRWFAGFKGARQRCNERHDRRPMTQMWSFLFRHGSTSRLMPKYALPKVEELPLSLLAPLRDLPFARRANPWSR